MYSFIIISLLISNPFVKEVKAMALCATFYPIDDSDILLKPVCIRGGGGAPNTRRSSHPPWFGDMHLRLALFGASMRITYAARAARTSACTADAVLKRARFIQENDGKRFRRERRWGRGRGFYYRLVRLSDHWSARISGISKRFEIAAHLIKYAFLIICFIFCECESNNERLQARDLQILLLNAII